MNTAGRLALYGGGLVVAFGAAFGLAGVFVPESLVAAWQEESPMDGHDTTESASSSVADALPGLALEADGYTLSPVEAPGAVSERGALRFQIQDDAGAPVTEFTTTHDKDLHLIVVRTDGTQFRHVHPELDTATGTWSLPWAWDAAGSYRVYADTTPAGASSVTLTRTIEVAGDVVPVERTAQRTDEVAGFTVTLDGDLVAGATSDLTLTISRDGEPVTTLQPYLGAFGHLVTLRAGDLAYLHVHPEGEEPEAGDEGGTGDPVRGSDPYGRSLPALPGLPGRRRRAYRGVRGRCRAR